MTCCDRRIQYANELAEIHRVLGRQGGAKAVAEVVAERDELRQLVRALAERVADQSELLTRRAGK